MPLEFSREFTACLRELSLEPKKVKTQGKKPVALLSVKAGDIKRVENPFPAFSFDLKVECNPSFPVAVGRFEEKTRKLLAGYRRKTKLSESQKSVAEKDPTFREATIVPSFSFEKTNDGSFLLKVTTQHEEVAKSIRSILSNWI